MRRPFLRAMLALAAAGACAGPCTAWSAPTGADAGYPNRPIRIIAPFAAGGIADTFARIIGKHLSIAWGQPVVVENRTGAGGNIGADIVAHAAPDGYTLVMGNNGTHAVNPSLFANMPFDPIADFTPVALVIEAEGLLVVPPSEPFSSVQDIIRAAKAAPGRLSYGSGGIGTTSHLAGELFKAKAGVDITHVPYKGNMESINDLVAGRTSMAFATMPTVLPFVKEGRLKAIAVIETQRSSALPAVPTIAESGVPGFDVKNWIGLFGPAGMPAPIVQKLNAEVQRIMRLPELRPQLAAAGARFTPTTPEQFARFVKTERQTWSGIIEAAGIKAQ